MAPSHLTLLQNSVTPSPHVSIGLQGHQNGVGVIATRVGGVVGGGYYLVEEGDVEGLRNGGSGGSGGEGSEGRVEKRGVRVATWCLGWG